ncbi:DVU3141 family protein [Sneathiella chinensis]|uniref:Surface antigen domain-containing protein n=1 Tax=Sneathiella chinensis TaxID=349750 RepID=A0ABQ5U3K4_9PROT|nr:DVU3141 family protein [Sneathiella chinensis]GLQ05770.1 hypothetical protein GCM10007924_09910 [Sneathiella chinensis]
MWKKLVVVFVVLQTAACGGIAGQAPGNAPVAKAPLDTAGRPYADPVAHFAINSPPGTSGNVTLPEGQGVEVFVGRDYISAANEKCRSIVVKDANGLATSNAVCFSNASWKTVLKVGK